MATNLSSRLDRVLAQGSTDSVETFRQLSLEEMGGHKVTFGKSHIGKTYAEMWQTEKGWIRWFSKTYGDSQKDEHRKMLAYVEAMIAQHEEIYEMAPLQENAQEVIRPHPKTQPKSKAAPAPMMMTATTEIMTEMDDPWDVMDLQTQAAIMHSPQQEMIDALQSRVLNMENVMGEILNHVRHANQTAP